MKKLDERGVSAVEFALILPVLLLILFGIVEFGLILYDQAVITNASREGARKGILYDVTARPTVDQVKTVVNNYTNAFVITFGNNTPVTKVFYDSAEVTTGTDQACTTFGKDLQVTVDYGYQFLVLSPIMRLFRGNLGTTLTLKASTTMRCE